MGRVDQSPIVACKPRPGLDQHLLERPQHQGQGRAELVADVREERGLGAVDLGQRLGPPALVLVSFDLGDRGGDMPADRSIEIQIRLIESAPRADAGDQTGGRLGAADRRDRDHDRLMGRFRPGIGGTELERHADRLDQLARAGLEQMRQLPERGPPGAKLDPVGCRRRARREAGSPRQTGRTPLVLELVKQGERHVMRVGADDARGHRARRLRAHERALVTEVAQNAQPALAEHPLGRLDDRDEDAADRSVLVADRAVGEREVAFLDIAVAVERQQLVDEGTGLAGRKHPVEHRPDEVPDLGESVGGARTERARMLGRAENRPVGVIVELDELRPPGDVHGIAGVQQDAERRPQALRPALDRPERRRRPVVGADQRAHRAAAGGKIGPLRAVTGRRRHPIDQAAAPPSESLDGPLATVRWLRKIAHGGRRTRVRGRRRPRSRPVGHAQPAGRNPGRPARPGGPASGSLGARWRATPAALRALASSAGGGASVTRSCRSASGQTSS